MHEDGKKMLCPWLQIWKKVPSHQFPKDPERCFEWIKSLKLDNLKNCTSTQMKNYKVCHEHFRPEDYSPCLHNRFLLNTAIPVIHIDTESDNTQANVQQQESRIDALKNQNREQHSQNPQCTNSKDTSIEGNNVFEEHDKAIAESEKSDCNAMQVCESSVSEQDEINQNHGQRLQMLEKKLNGLTNAIKRRPQLQEIKRCRNLSPMSRRLYQINIELKRRNRYLKRKMHNIKQQKKKETVPIVSKTVNTDNSNATIRKNFVRMITRNNNVLPQVCSD